MKTLIIVKESEYTWMRDFFPSRHPLLAPVCNKPLLSYWVDFAIHCGSREIRLVSDGSLSEVENRFGDGIPWGVELTYAPIRETDELEDVLKKNSRFSANARLLVMQGCFFLHYDKNTDYTRFFQTAPSGEVRNCDTGRILIRGDVSAAAPGSGGDPTPLVLVPLKSINILHQLSMDVLTTHAYQYVLPGYTNETGIHIGRDTMIDKTVRINQPVMIGDHVKIHKDAVIGPDVVIGSHVIIDAHSRVRRSVIMDGTYVGGHLDFDRKVAAGQTLVDPREGTVMNMVDPQLLSEVKEKADGGYFKMIWHGLLAVLLAAMQAIPYAVLVPMLKWQGRWRCTEAVFFQNGRGDVIRQAHITIDRTGYCGRLAKRMALDRFGLLAQVVRGKLNLIGHRLVRANEHNREILKDKPGYYPGVFSYAEGECWPMADTEREISEYFHSNQGNLVHDLVMVTRALLNKSCEETQI